METKDEEIGAAGIDEGIEISARTPVDELDRFDPQETEDLDDQNAIRFILKVYRMNLH